MIYLSKSIGQQYTKALRRLKKGADPLEVAQQLIAIDADSGAGYLIAGLQHVEAGRTDEGEQCLWNGLRRAPGQFQFYIALARARVLRDPDDDLGELPLDAETYAVVKTHSLKRDTAWVARLLQTEIPYVGILGPRVSPKGARVMTKTQVGSCGGQPAPSCPMRSPGA